MFMVIISSEYSESIWVNTFDEIAGMCDELVVTDTIYSRYSKVKISDSNYATSLIISSMESDIFTLLYLE